MRIDRGRYYGWVRGLWFTFWGFWLTVVLYFVALSYNFLGLFGEIPSLEELANPRNELASEIYSADNVLMGKYYRENRTLAKYEELSPYLINALIATEDVRFEEHSGIDLRALLRAVMARGNDGGGSTLSQQLAKNLFRLRQRESEGTFHKVPVLRTLVTKTKEWVTSVKIERNYTKKEIIELYLNTVEFGSNAFGINTASRTFFDKNPSQLNVQESAMLVGLLKAPSKYSPYHEKKNAIERRNVVLGQMEKYGFLSAEQSKHFQAQPLVPKRGEEEHTAGIAPYFRVEAQKWLLDWGKREGRDIYKDGLRIYTTIDSKMQVLAEQAVVEHLYNHQQVFDAVWRGRNPWIDDKGYEIKDFIQKEAKKSERYRKLVERFGNDKTKIDQIMNTPTRMRVYTLQGEKDTTMTPMDSIRYYKRFLQAGFMVMEPQTGHVKAWVGGANYKHFKYDHVYLGKRQPGSTFKPIIYTAALDLAKGYTPCSQLKDEPVTIGDWTPVNSSGGWSGAYMNLRTGIATSTNSIVVRLMKTIGIANAVSYARELGIKSPLDSTSATICLGTSDVNIFELLSVYATFANRGKHIDPMFITRIEDRNGNVIKDFTPIITQSISEDLAYQMTFMLMGSTQDVNATSTTVANYGIGESIMKNNEIAAKTGTTQYNADAWFMGYTQNLASGVWVGGDTWATRFESIAYGQGAVMALPVWAKFYEKLYAHPELSRRYPKTTFEKPEEISVELNCGAIRPSRTRRATPERERMKVNDK